MYLNLSMAEINIEGCMTGSHVGGGGKTGGALIQWAGLNIPCFMNEMAESERHVETRARLKCASKPYRNAIAYDFPKKERQAQCITWTINVTKGEIDYLKELVAAQEAEYNTVGDQPGK